MARKRTKQEALDRLKLLPDFPKPFAIKSLPLPLRPIATIPYIFDQGGKAIARLLIQADPLNRLDDSTIDIINNPQIVADEVGNVLELIEPLQPAAVDEMFRRSPGRQEIFNPPAVKKPRKVTKKMRMQRKIQSTAFRNANAKGRKKDGTFRSGYDQRRIALLAQKECTKERVKQGLCEKPKRRSTRKGQVRKTSRRAFE